MPQQQPCLAAMLAPAPPFERPRRDIDTNPPPAARSRRPQRDSTEASDGVLSSWLIRVISRLGDRTEGVAADKIIAPGDPARCRKYVTRSSARSPAATNDPTRSAVESSFSCSKIGMATRARCDQCAYDRGPETPAPVTTTCLSRKSMTPSPPRVFQRSSSESYRAPPAKNLFLSMQRGAECRARSIPRRSRHVCSLAIPDRAATMDFSQETRDD